VIRPLIRDLHGCGLTEIIWDVDTQDWNGVSTDAIVQTASTLTSGQIVLMHDGFQTTINAVPQIVAGLTSRGLCAGMISPTTGRAVAPDAATTPTSAAPATTRAVPTTSAAATTRPPTTTPAATTRPPVTTPAQTTPASGGTCRVSAQINAWNTGLTANVTITNTGPAAINGWRLVFTLPAGQIITSGWNATYAPTTGQVTATNMAYNGSIAPNASVSIGFQATHTGNSAKPASFTLNATACANA
jgi:hypothetical protein